MQAAAPAAANVPAAAPAPAPTEGASLGDIVIDTGAALIADGDGGGPRIGLPDYKQSMM